MNQIDFETLNTRARTSSGFDLQDEQLLQEVAAQLTPYLPQVTEQFYAELQENPETAPYLEGRIDALKATHQRWMESIFQGPWDADFAAQMHRVGEVHVKVELPVEFMASGILLIKKHLMPILTHCFADDAQRLGAVMKAINGITGYCLIIMQESYQSSLLASELERFMAITGISRKLFNNLAAAYRKQEQRPVAA